MKSKDLQLRNLRETNVARRRLTVDGPGNIYVLTYTFPFTGPGTEPFYMLRFAADATGNAGPTAALLSVSGAGIAAH